jgi:FMN reductase
MLRALEARACETSLIDLATLPTEALLARTPSPEVDDAIAAVGAADIVIAATPTYRALYTGLLKCFFDLMPQSHLAGKPCIGLQTGIGPDHALAAEYGFRPLFASLDGVPVTVLYATDAEFVNGAPNPPLRERVDASLGPWVLLPRTG